MKIPNRTGYKTVSSELTYVLCFSAIDFASVQAEWNTFLESHDRTFSVTVVTNDDSEESIDVRLDAAYKLYWNQNKACGVRTELFLNQVENAEEKHFYPALDDETEGVLIKFRIYDYSHPGITDATAWIEDTLKAFSRPAYLKHESVEYYPLESPHEGL